MEHWKNVAGFEKYYEVSNAGVIRKTQTKMILTQSNSHGYKTVRLTKDKKRSIGSVHRIVATAFLDQADFKEVNHIDTCKGNNCVENLEWCTRVHNVNHANQRGLINYHRKLNTLQVLTIKTLIMSKWTNRRISTAFNVSESVISEIKHRKAWKHINVY